MLVEYIKTMLSPDETIQKLAITIGKMENKAIIKFLDKNGLTNILERFLSKRELNRYYRSKYKIKVLLNK